MDLRSYYELRGSETPLTEDLPPLAYDGERRRRTAVVAFASPRPGDHVLDVGCGDGFLLDAIAASEATVAGVEISAVRLAQARTRLAGLRPPVALEIADAADLPFPSATFSLVVCTEVLEHLEDPGAALREALRVLMPGGRIVCSVPHREHIAWHRCIHCGEMTSVSGHLTSFDAAKMTALLEAAGFIEVSTRGTYPLVNRRGIAGRILRTLPEHLWTRLDVAVGSRANKGNWLMAHAIRP